MTFEQLADLLGERLTEALGRPCLAYYVHEQGLFRCVWLHNKHKVVHTFSREVIEILGIDAAIEPLRDKYKPKPKPWGGGIDVGAELQAVFGCMDTPVTHPVDGDTLPLGNAVVHLNDKHQWSRDQIADWLETLDIDMTLKAG